MQEEKQIENQILNYLARNDIFAFKVKSQGTFDPTINKFRRPSRHYKRGTADILGIYKTRPLAIEVKSAKGRLSNFQKIFLQEWENNGGISIVARSVEDVQKTLGEVDERLLAAAVSSETSAS